MKKVELPKWLTEAFYGCEKVEKNVLFFYYYYYFILKTLHLSSKRVKRMESPEPICQKSKFFHRRYCSKLGGTFSVKDELSPHKTLLARPLLLLGGAGGRKVAY